MTSLFSYPTLNKNVSVHNQAMPASVILVAGVEFIAVPSAIKLKDKNHCRPRDQL
jgi:hypothetical protein